MQSFRMKPWVVYTLSMTSLLFVVNVGASNSHSPVIVGKDVKHDTSIPVRDVPLFSGKPSFANNVRNIITRYAGNRLTVFQGIGVGLGSYSVTKSSPEISGSVGTTQYVQWVDPDIGVFDKATGAIAPGFPKPGSAIWFGFGGPCETQNMGSPNTKFDPIEKRWVVTRQAFENETTGPFYQCIAVSTTEDAAGSYYRYAFTLDSVGHYGGVGVWSDAYYLALTMFGPVSEGPRVCAFEKDKMIMGSPANMQCNQLSIDESSPLRPATVEGGANPVGYPEYFFGLNAPDTLLLFKYHVDWQTPTNTTLSSAIAIPVATFVKPCPTTSGNNCAVQPNTTNRLDVLGDRITSRINFRQFPNFGSIVLAHNIQGTPTKFSPAVRWYELRRANNPTANFVIHQQDTLAPDSKARFSPSIAIDRFQNIAMGYTVSSSAVHPSPEMGYRNYFDPLNDLIIQPLVTGLGSEDTISAWTTTSTMSVDPIDSCTFWYSSEYLKTNGNFNWSTAIVKFKLAAC